MSERARALLSPEQFERSLDLQVWLGAVKACQACGIKKPVDLFDHPTRGRLDVCEPCRRERRLAAMNVAQDVQRGRRKAKPRPKSRRMVQPPRYFFD